MHIVVQIKAPILFQDQADLRQIAQDIFEAIIVFCVEKKISNHDEILDQILIYCGLLKDEEQNIFKFDQEIITAMLLQTLLNNSKLSNSKFQILVFYGPNRYKRSTIRRIKCRQRL